MPKCTKKAPFKNRYFLTFLKHQISATGTCNHDCHYLLTGKKVQKGAK